MQQNVEIRNKLPITICGSQLTYKNELQTLFTNTGVRQISFTCGTKPVSWFPS